MNTPRLDLSSFKKAVASLDAALSRDKDEFIRDSVIQRFEYTYELSWKFLARQLEIDVGSEAVDRLSRRDLYRLGVEKGFLRDASAWFEYHTARNTTSHSYNIAVAESVYDVAKRFIVDARDLLSKLAAIYG
jgi:nucleotidyltransferase substrate binding protein (TIGR01987 family)